MKRLTDKEIDEKLSSIKGWMHDMGALSKDFTFHNFTQAIEFVNKVADLAEELQHHPDIFLYEYKHVQILSTTHDVEGLTQKDFDLAQKINNL